MIIKTVEKNNTLCAVISNDGIVIKMHNLRWIC